MTKFEQIINGKPNKAYSLEGLQKELKPIKEIAKEMIIVFLKINY